MADAMIEATFFAGTVFQMPWGQEWGTTLGIPKEDAAVDRLRNVVLSNRNQRRPSRMCVCVRGFLFYRMSVCCYECISKLYSLLVLLQHSMCLAA